MRKRYLFLLMLLFPLATMLTSSRVHAQTDAQYSAALAAIEDLGSYYITTEYAGTKYYLTAGGTLTQSKDEAPLFTFSKTSGGEFKTYGFYLDGGANTYFSNPASSANINDTKLNTHSIEGCRTTWDAQVFFFDNEGKFAVRTTNAATGTSGWNLVGSAFWVVKASGNVPYAGYSYDAAFIWVLEDESGNTIDHAPEVAQVYIGLSVVLDKYADQLWDDESGEGTNIGPNYGQYSDVETWGKFWNLLQQINDICEHIDPDAGYTWIGTPGECPTPNEAEVLSVDADSMWQKIVDSEVPYVPENGYYRIYTAERYKSKFDETGYVDKAWAASFEKAHANKGVYGTVKKNQANFVWKITKSETGDSLTLYNVGMGTYVSKSSYDNDGIDMTEDPNDAIYFVFDFAGFLPVEFGVEGGETNSTIEERNVFAIRPAFQPRGGYYVHQMAHGTGNKDDNSPFGYYQTDSGEDKEFSYWARTYNTDRTEDKWTSEWYLEPVPESEVEELVENFEMIKNHDLLVAQNNDLRAKVKVDLEVAKDVIKTKLITSASQMTSPYSQNDFGGKDGGNLSDGVLIDGDKTTYWHSAFTDTPQEPHYIQISDMEDMVGECELYLCERAGASNDRPSEFKIVGADNTKADDSEWALIAELKVPDYAAGAENYIPFTVETAYPYIRVICTNTDCASDGISYRYFWHASELQISTVRPNPNSQFAALGEIAENLEKIYKENIAVADADITPEMYRALEDAYKLFLGGMVDPTELRNALETYADLTKGVVEGTNPGQWTSTDIATAYDELYKEVKDYDEAGRYNVAQNHKYAVMLKSMSKSVMELANGVKTDAWYHIMFPTKEMYTDYGFDPNLPGGNSKIVGDSLQFGYYVVPGVRTAEKDIDDKATGNYFLNFASKEDARAGMYMYFANPKDLEDQDVSMFRFVEHENLWAKPEALLQETKENMSMALDLSTTYTKGEPLITDASQLSSNASDSSEGKNIGSLIDGEKSTYWHSDYHKNVLEPAYLQVQLNEPVSGLIEIDVTRRQGATNGHVIHMYIMGSNDGENWTRVGYIETPFTSQNESVTSQPVDLGGTYSYLRFILTKRYGTDSGGNMEFDPFAEITSADEYNKLWTYFHAAEFQIYPVTPDTELSESAEALQNAFTTINKVLFKDASAEDVANAAQAYATYRSEFNVEAGKPVLPKGADKVAPVYAIQNKATGLFVNCKGSNNANNSLELIPTFFNYKAIGFQRSLMNGVRIDSVDCSYLHSQNFDHRFVTWNATSPDSNSGLVLVEATEPYEAPESFSFYRNVKPGRIADWCNSVSITVEDAPDGAYAYKAIGQYTEGEGEDAAIYLALKTVETIPAGDPALFIYGDTTYYEPDVDDMEPVLFTMPGEPEMVLKGATVNGLKGCISQYSLRENDIYFDGKDVLYAKTDGATTVTQCSAILKLEDCPVIDPTAETIDYSIWLGGAGVDVTDAVKNIPAAIQNIAKGGDVYSMDGKLLRTNATLNSLKALGKGMYILNGVKVLVK